MTDATRGRRVVDANTYLRDLFIRLSSHAEYEEHVGRMQTYLLAMYERARGRPFTLGHQIAEALPSRSDAAWAAVSWGVSCGYIAIRNASGHTVTFVFTPDGAAVFHAILELSA